MNYYRDSTKRILDLLRDDDIWQQYGVLADEHGMLTTIIDLLADLENLYSGSSWSMDEVVRALWQHGEPRDVHSPYADITASGVEQLRIAKSLTEGDLRCRSGRISSEIKAVVSCVRVFEHYLRTLRNGIRNAEKWDEAWLKPYDQFRERANHYYPRLESFLGTAAGVAANLAGISFDRLEEASSLRFGRGILPPKSVTLAAGQPYLAMYVIRSIISRATATLLVVDNYISADTLHFIEGTASAVATQILTKSGVGKNASFIAAAKRWKVDRGSQSLEVRESNAIHDRYLVLDGAIVYQVGHSIKDLGTKLTTLSLQEGTSASSALAAIMAEWSSGNVVTI